MKRDAACRVFSFVGITRTKRAILFNMIYRILLNSLIAFVSLFFIAKLLGKKQIAELTFCDYVVGISLGSISAEWAIDSGDKPWYVYCAAIFVFFALSLVIDFAERKNPFLKKLFKGSPIVLVSNGEIDYVNLKKSKLDVNALLGMCRVAGYFDLRDVAYAVFETSGELSILPRSDCRSATTEELGIRTDEARLIMPFVIDGLVYEKALRQSGKDMAWLERGLEGKDVKRVLLACYDPAKDELFVKMKNSERFAETVK